MKKKRKLLRKILWTTLFGAIEIGILFFSNWISNKFTVGSHNAWLIGLGMLAFFVLSYIVESIEDKA